MGSGYSDGSSSKGGSAFISTPEDQRQAMQPFAFPGQQNSVPACTNPDNPTNSSPPNPPRPTLGERIHRFFWGKHNVVKGGR